MSKRGNGEGSIYYRNSDGKWIGSVTLDKGKRKVFYGKTRKEVQEKLKRVLLEQQQGTLIITAPQTVSQFLTDWLENTHRRRIRPRTYEWYREAVDLHIIPSLGRYQLQKLTVQQVQAFYTKKADEGLAPATIIYYHSVLHNALDTAVKRGLVFRNVCDLRLHASTVRNTAVFYHESLPICLSESMSMWKQNQKHKTVVVASRSLNFALKSLQQHHLRQEEVRLKAGEFW
jgi:hypothetical protein